MATVLLPYIAGMLKPQTEAWAKQQNGILRCQLDPGDDAAYWELLATWWRAPGELIVVEHDMVPRPGVVDRMADCRYSWCISPYYISGGQLCTTGLGCARFAERTRRRYPALMDRVGTIEDTWCPARSWRRLDERVSRVMHDLGYRPHLHGRSKHLHDYRVSL